MKFELQVNTCCPPVYFVGELFGTEEEKQSGRPQIREVKVQPDKFDNC